MNSAYYGLVAEFSSAEALVHAAKKTYAQGYKKVEAFSPFPIEELSEALHIQEKRIPFLVLMAGILGGLTGFSLQYYVSVIAYPIRVGGKPLNSWPSFIPVTYELTILGAALAAVLSMIILNNLPMPYHAIFNTKNFERATLDRFFLCVLSDDSQFDREKTRKFLLTLDAQAVSEVEA